MNQDTKIYLSLVVIVVLIIAGIFYWKNLNRENPEEIVMKCISSKAAMYSQIGCSHCIEQKQILGNYANLFNITECNEGDNRQKCADMGIALTPTWIINGNKYPGLKSIAELKNITGC